MGKRNRKNWFRHGNWWKRLRNNRKYRDVLFRQLFQDKKDLLDLYNALNGSTYQNPEEIEENIKRGMRREEAVHTAIDTCVEKGILRDILIKQKAEVMHMLLTEYDEKKHMRTLFREGREKGREEGREAHLWEQVKKKLDKRKAIPEIAEELEEEISVIQRMIDKSRLGEK